MQWLPHLQPFHVCQKTVRKVSDDIIEYVPLALSICSTNFTEPNCQSLSLVEHRGALTISMSSSAVTRSSSSRLVSSAFVNASFINSESGLPSIWSIMAGSRSFRGSGTVDGSPSAVCEFCMPQRRRLSIVTWCLCWR